MLSRNAIYAADRAVPGTPAFFYVIDWLGESRLFGLSWLRKFNGAVLGTLSLRPARWAVRQLAEQLAAASRRRKRPEPPSIIEHVIEIPPDDVIMLIDTVPGVIHEPAPHRPKRLAVLLKRTKVANDE